jgi:hypothetical protein
MAKRNIFNIYKGGIQKEAIGEAMTSLIKGLPSFLGRTMLDMGKDWIIDKATGAASGQRTGRLPRKNKQIPSGSVNLINLISLYKADPTCNSAEWRKLVPDQVNRDAIRMYFEKNGIPSGASDPSVKLHPR